MASSFPQSELQDLADLLDLAERVQASYESSVRRESIWRLAQAVLVVVAAAVLLWAPFKTEQQAISIAIGVPLFLYVLAIDVVVIQRIRRRSGSDRNALREVVGLLHELEGIAAHEDHWTALQRAEFRIRLSRFQIEEPSSFAHAMFRSTLGR